MCGNVGGVVDEAAVPVVVPAAQAFLELGGEAEAARRGETHRPGAREQSGRLVVREPAGPQAPLDAVLGHEAQAGGDVGVGLVAGHAPAVSALDPAGQSADVAQLVGGELAHHVLLGAAEDEVLGVVLGQRVGETVAAVEPGHLVEALAPHRLVDGAVAEVEEVLLELVDPGLDLRPQVGGDLQVGGHALVVAGMAGREDVGRGHDVRAVVDDRVEREEWSRRRRIRLHPARRAAQVRRAQAVERSVRRDTHGCRVSASTCPLGRSWCCRDLPRHCFRITIEPMERKIQGKDIFEEQLDEGASEAEAGYDVAWLKKRMGRPSRADSAAKVVPVRLSDAELEAVMARAKRENLNRSDAIRQALAQWAAAS